MRSLIPLKNGDFLVLLAKITDRCKIPTQVKNFYTQKLLVDDFVEEINQMENGTSRIYFIVNFLP